MMALQTRIQAEIDAWLPEITELRHALHREPELALQETQTRAKLHAALVGERLDFRAPLLGTDLIAETGAGSRCIALRADIDAIPVLEQTGLPYASINTGIMHACGHDGHMAMLVGAAKVLARLADALPQRVRFIFQPGEEVRAAGRDLVARGACDGVDEVYAVHGWAGLPLGAVGSRVGPLLAAASFFDITLIGQGCHGAQPERGNNPIPIAAALVRRLLDEHRRLNQRDGSVISVTAFNAGSNGNVIPDRARLQGTCRYLRPEMADEMESVIRTASESVAAAVELTYTRSYELPVMNTEAGVAKIRRAAGDQYIELPAPSMGAEDFAYYLPGREGAMFLLGQGEDACSLHTSTFDFNDATLAAGIRMYCLLAL